MTTMYFANYDTCEPEEVECEKPEYPNRDAKGRTIFVSSHFASIDECWGRILAELNAARSIATGRLVEAEEAVAAAKERLGSVCKQLLQAETNHRLFLARGATSGRPS